VASGALVGGTVESNGQPRYMVLGATLELASRLANLTPSGQFLVTQENAEKLPIFLPSVMLPRSACAGRHTLWRLAAPGGHPGQDGFESLVS
jgi:class 3 adenylate cyclase